MRRPEGPVRAAAQLESPRTKDQIFASADALPAIEEGDSTYAIRATG
jgi:hypothetical protein